MLHFLSWGSLTTSPWAIMSWLMAYQTAYITEVCENKWIFLCKVGFCFSGRTWPFFWSCSRFSHSVLVPCRGFALCNMLGPGGVGHGALRQGWSLCRAGYYITFLLGGPEARWEPRDMMRAYWHRSIAPVFALCIILGQPWCLEQG